jgi:hypothetical protein
VALLRQGGEILKRILGCWQGTTAERPLEFRVLSPLAYLLRVQYHTDVIRICMTLENDDVKVTDSSAAFDPNSPFAGLPGPDYGYSYHVLSASGAEITLEVRTSAPLGGPFVGEVGPAHFNLNEDDTINDRWEITMYDKRFSPSPIVRVVTTAQLHRVSGSASAASP